MNHCIFILSRINFCLIQETSEVTQVVLLQGANSSMSMSQSKEQKCFASLGAQATLDSGQTSFVCVCVCVGVCVCVCVCVFALHVCLCKRFNSVSNFSLLIHPKAVHPITLDAIYVRVKTPMSKAGTSDS